MSKKAYRRNQRDGFEEKGHQKTTNNRPPRGRGAELARTGDRGISEGEKQFLPKRKGVEQEKPAKEGGGSEERNLSGKGGLIGVGTHLLPQYLRPRGVLVWVELKAGRLCKNKDRRKETWGLDSKPLDTRRKRLLLSESKGKDFDRDSPKRRRVFRFAKALRTRNP